MVEQILVLVGLPGSGKTFWGNVFLSYAVPRTARFFDDKRMRTYPIHQQPKVLLIAHPAFTSTESRITLVERLEQLYPTANVAWLFFENAPVKCKRNVIRRHDGRLVFGYIEHASTKYIIPKEFEPFSIWDLTS